MDTNAHSQFPFVFSLEECGGAGDCFFHCIAAAMRGGGRGVGGDVTTMEEVRSVVSVSMTAEFEADLLTETKLADLASVQAACLLSGNAVQGTDTVMRVLQRAFRWLGAIVLTPYGPAHSQVFHPEEDEEEKGGGGGGGLYVLLYNVPNYHWQLVRLGDGSCFVDRRAADCLCALLSR